ncbi:hypothetical protein EJB05_50165, partial [Eragrostis curvula]
MVFLFPNSKFESRSRNLKRATAPSPAVDAFRPTARSGCLTGGGSIPAAGGGLCSWRSTRRHGRLPVRARFASKASWALWDDDEVLFRGAVRHQLGGGRPDLPLPLQTWTARGLEVPSWRRPRGPQPAADLLVPRQHRWARGSRSPGYAAAAESSSSPNASKGGGVSNFDPAPSPSSASKDPLQLSPVDRVEHQFRTDYGPWDSRSARSTTGPSRARMWSSAAARATTQVLDVADEQHSRGHGLIIGTSLVHQIFLDRLSPGSRRLKLDKF